MFRYAAPQKGRYREFWQIGFEAMGSDDPAVDAELIQLFTEIERRAGIGHTRIELNSIGKYDQGEVFGRRDPACAACMDGDDCGHEMTP